MAEPWGCSASMAKTARSGIMAGTGRIWAARFCRGTRFEPLRRRALRTASKPSPPARGEGFQPVLNPRRRSGSKRVPLQNLAAQIRPVPAMIPDLAVFAIDAEHPQGSAIFRYLDCVVPVESIEFTAFRAGYLFIQIFLGSIQRLSLLDGHIGGGGFVACPATHHAARA